MVRLPEYCTYVPRIWPYRAAASSPSRLADSAVFVVVGWDAALRQNGSGLSSCPVPVSGRSAEKGCILSLYYFVVPLEKPEKNPSSRKLSGGGRERLQERDRVFYFLFVSIC